MPTLTPDQKRRLLVKRVNEHAKLVATGFNTLAMASLLALVIVPYASKPPTQPDYDWLYATLVLFVSAHVALRFIQSEE